MHQWNRGLMVSLQCTGVQVLLGERGVEGRGLAVYPSSVYLYSVYPPLASNHLPFRRCTCHRSGRRGAR
eukprot:207447-Prorocentrum_minimum.AAC.1